MLELTYEEVIKNSEEELVNKFRNFLITTIENKDWDVLIKMQEKINNVINNLFLKLKAGTITEEFVKEIRLKVSSITEKLWSGVELPEDWPFEFEGSEDEENIQLKEAEQMRSKIDEITR